MSKKDTINEFLSCKTFALAGMSRNGRQFGNSVYKELTQKGYKIYPVHPYVKSIDGVQCYPDLESLPEKVESAMIVLPPVQTEIFLKSAARNGIKKVWMQQGAESENALQFCRDNGIGYVHKECILMFADPIGAFHGFHRFIWKLIGKYPK